MIGVRSASRSWPTASTPGASDKHVLSVSPRRIRMASESRPVPHGRAPPEQMPGVPRDAANDVSVPSSGSGSSHRVSVRLPQALSSPVAGVVHADPTELGHAPKIRVVRPNRCLGLRSDSGNQEISDSEVFSDGNGSTQPTLDGAPHRC